MRFRDTFKKYRREIFKIDKKTDILHLPSEEILDAVKIQLGVDRRPIVKHRMGERPDREQRAGSLQDTRGRQHHRHKK